MSRKIILGVVVFAIAAMTWLFRSGSFSAERRLAERQLVELRSILEHAERFELYSVNPELPHVEPWEAAATQPAGAAAAAPERLFRGYRTYGKTQVSDRDARRKLASAIHTLEGGQQKRCFSPRHAIFATRGARQLDLLICFECGHVHAHLDGERLWFVPDYREEPFYDHLLVTGHVPLAPKK